MKTFFTLMLLTGLALMFQNCVEDQKLDERTVQISFTLKPDPGSKVEALPDDTRLRISIEDNTGDEIKYLEEIPFSKVENGYLTEPLDLWPGTYVINDFVLVNEKSEIIFAAPKNHSVLSASVEHSLNENVHIMLGKAFDLNLELLAVENHHPKDFGYPSFRLDQSNVLNVAVNVVENRRLRLTSGEAFILNEYDTVAHYALQSKMNRINFEGDAVNTYKLIVVKDGYSRYCQTFLPGTLSQWKKPIIAEIRPAMTMVAVTDSSGQFSFELDGFPGDIVIDWGDGTFETNTLSDPNAMDVIRDRQYEKPGRYFISITGALEQIQTLLFSQGHRSKTDRVNLERLPALMDLRFMFTHVPKYIDVSRNHNLMFLILWATDAEFLKISSVKPPMNIELELSGRVTMAAIDGIIDNVYDYAIRNNTAGDYFISWLYHPDPSDHMIIAPIGPPSPRTRDKMRTLESMYRVDFNPDVDYAFGSREPY